jgi:hypothetical protein
MAFMGAVKLAATATVTSPPWAAIEIKREEKARR